MAWGTVFTNGCCSRLVGASTKVWQPFTTNMHTRKMSDINDVLPKLWLDLCQILNFSSLHKTQYWCGMLQWGTVFTNDCCSRLVGPITKVWQPFTTNMHTRKMSDINDVLSKLRLDFCQILDFSPLQDSIYQWAWCNEALYSPMIVAVGWLGPIPRSDNPLQVAQWLWTCQTSMMWCQKVRLDFSRILKFLSWTD